MLIINRKVGETVVLGGGVVVRVVAVQPNRVSLGFDAPQSVSIWRGEVAEERAARKAVGEEVGPHPPLVEEKEGGDSGERIP